ncbi:MAG: TAT-variant-translocated molybdopterin oxidoreductase [Bacteroidetes bacterium]|nr:TAT-variant-translocated molybdopterin oxidoreductase [Bacteroidota bacterium]MBS1740878.1 TAT-variant-translocated molybdopterin oxidoreductase [Bacteroidota bacterium]
MSQKQYWKGLEELNKPAQQEVATDEFNEDLPFDLSGNLLDATTPRRDFLKYLGFSTAAAMLAASCEMPVRKVIPYAIKPDDITPGVPNYYASTFVDNGDYCAIVIKTRDGRPIKIEGNEKSSITRGGTSARVQASVLSLYDKARLRQPFSEGHEATFAAIDKAVAEGMSGLSGQAYLLTGSILSPTTKEVINQFIAKFPTVKHIVYDPISYSGMLQANEASYGKRALPSYQFDQAQTIFSLGADFLGTWLSPIEFAKQYSAGRRIGVKNLKMSKHYQVESIHTITGAKADERAVCKPSEMGAVAIALYNAVTTGAAPSFGSKKLNDTISKAAADLKKGNGLVVCGANDVNLQTVVNAINDKIGANGTTINWSISSNYKQGIDSDMVNLVNAMNSGQVGALFIHGVNPVYEYFQGAKFAEGLKKVKLTVSFADRMDETAQQCKFVVPDNHYLESWGDAEPKTGYISLMQPGIAPIFKTRAFQDSLLTWAGATNTYGQFWNQYWSSKLGNQENFDRTLQEGIIEPATAPSASGATFTGNVANAINALQSSKPASGNKELVLYEKVSIGRGAWMSNNPWLQEMPDPITRGTWDNYACVSPKTAFELGAELTSINEVDYKKHVIKIIANGITIELPIVTVPGMHNDVIAIAVGYGRDEKVGRAAAKTGKNAYPFQTWNGLTFDLHTGVNIEKTNDFYDIALTQTHNSYEGRAIIHEYSLEEFSKNPEELYRDREEEIGHYTTLPWKKEGHEGTEPKLGEYAAAVPATDALEEGFRENGTLYPNHESPGIHWGMSIDLTACIGCGACVIGCQAENNVSVVGKTHVLKAQEMHWMRIDRYFSGMPNDPDTIQTVFQPMLCQHCDNAPCENVCPVAATPHSSEGLNMMTYNRCIGTKYCANNCPYKVRHFNWMDWNGADCFQDNLYEDGRRDDMNDDLTRMVLNPDVTVRSRGVMEKCTFCVQRLQDAKLHAKKEGRPLQDGEAKTACQQACPTDAILFGNVNDRSSAIYKLRAQEQVHRKFYVLEQLHTLPNVNYLSLIRNTDVIVGGNEKLDGLMNDHI